MTTLITVLVVLVLRHYYMCSIVCKAPYKIFNTRLYSIRSWYRLWRSASIDLWCRRQSRYSINGMDRDCRSGYVSFLQMLVMPLVFISIIGAFTK